MANAGFINTDKMPNIRSSQAEYIKEKDQPLINIDHTLIMIQPKITMLPDHVVNLQMFLERLYF